MAGKAPQVQGGASGAIGPSSLKTEGRRRLVQVGKRAAQRLDGTRLQGRRPEQRQSRQAPPQPTENFSAPHGQRRDKSIPCSRANTPRPFF